MQTIKRSSWKHVTPKEYQSIKSFLAAGVKASAIQELTGRGSATIYGIKKSESFKDYKQYLQELKKPKAVLEPATSELLFDGKPLRATASFNTAWLVPEPETKENTERSATEVLEDILVAVNKIEKQLSEMNKRKGIWR